MTFMLIILLEEICGKIAIKMNAATFLPTCFCVTALGLTAIRNCANIASVNL
jgi:hypothetical protein